MKKLLCLIFLLLSIFPLITIDNKAATISAGSISNNTTIESDIKVLGLNYDDYFTLESTETNNKYYNQWYVIAVGENIRKDDYVDVYLYMYNAIVTENISLNFNITINDISLSAVYDSNNLHAPDYDVYLGLVQKSDTNILKLHFTYNNYLKERKYTITGKDINKNEELIPFEATMMTSDNKINTVFNYNSHVYITNDVLCCIEFYDWDTSDWWERICHDFDIFSDEKMVQMFFYNFSSSKKIDKIIEVDCIYNEIQGEELFWLEPETGTRLKTVSSQTIKETPVSKSLYNKVTKQLVHGTECTFNAFRTPSQDRLSEFKNAVSFNENLFTSYEHSVLVDIKPRQEVYSQLKYVDKSEIFLLESGKMQVLECKDDYYTIKDFELKRLKFSTDGEIYNAYVSDDPDDAEHIQGSNPNAEKIKDAWEKFIEFCKNVVEWFTNYFPMSLYLLIGIIVFLVVLFAIGGPQLIIKTFFDLVIYIFKAVIWILCLPIELIKAIIGK